MTFRDKLEQAMEERDCSVEELADALCIEPETIERWLQPHYRHRTPKKENLTMIVKLLELEPDYFDECFDDDYARLRSNNKRARYTHWAGDCEEEE